MTDDYVPARGSNLSDEEGRALLRSLCNLSLAGEYDVETGKKIRAGSYAARSAVADLQAAMIKAAAHFEHYYHFNDWLGRNHCESFMHEHPSYQLSDLSHEFRAIRSDVGELRKSYSSLVSNMLPFLLELSFCLPKKLPEEEQGTVATAFDAA